MELAPDSGQEFYKTPFVLLCNMPHCAHAQVISSFAQKCFIQNQANTSDLQANYCT